jgi:EF-hand domain-containing protein 1
MMTIYEPPQRNAGIIGGKFMERTRVLQPGSTLSSPSGPTYYEAHDLYVGATIEVLRHRFVLLDADEYVFNYMEGIVANGGDNRHTFLGGIITGHHGGTINLEGPAYIKSDRQKVYAKAKKAAHGNSALKKHLEERLKSKDVGSTGVVDRKVLVNECRDAWKGILDDHVSLQSCFSIIYSGFKR